MAVTISLYVTNNIFQKHIIELQSEIEQNKSQVAALNEGSSLLQVSHLLKTNSSIIEKLEQQSQIVSYINHLRQISSSYSLGISGFNYSGEQVGVNVASTTQTGKTSTFVDRGKLINECEQVSASPNKKFKLFI